MLSNFTGELKLRWQNYKEMDRRDKLMYWGDFLIRNAIYIIIGAVVIYVQIFSIQNNFHNTFLSFNSIVNILTRSASAMFLALGVGGIIVLTGTDLSAGRLMGLTAVVCASLLQLPVEQFSAKMFPDLVAPPILLVLLLAMAIGGVFGIFNGFCTAKFKLHPFIVTLATSMIVYGLVLIYVQLGTNSGGPIRHNPRIPKRGYVHGEYRGNAGSHLCVLRHRRCYHNVVYMEQNHPGQKHVRRGREPGSRQCFRHLCPQNNDSYFHDSRHALRFFRLYRSRPCRFQQPLHRLPFRTGRHCRLCYRGVSFTGGVGKISGIVTGVILLQVISVALQWLGVAGDIQFIITGVIILVAVAIDMRKYLAKR